MPTYDTVAATGATGGFCPPLVANETGYHSPLGKASMLIVIQVSSLTMPIMAIIGIVTRELRVRPAHHHGTKTARLMQLASW